MPREECCQRLAAAIDPASAWRGTKPVKGSIGAQSLIVWKRIDYRNSFQYRLSATLTDELGGTRVSGRFAMHTFVLVFIAGFVGIVGMIVIGVLPGQLGPMLAGNAPRDGWAALIPLWMLLGVIAMLLFGRAIGMREGAFLADFVRTTVEAR